MTEVEKRATAQEVIKRVKKRHEVPQIELVKDFASTMYLRIEVPLPLRNLGKLRRGFYQTFAGDENATWVELITGEKVSTFSNQALYLFIFFLFSFSQYLIFQRPEAYKTFYSLTFLTLLLIRANRFNLTNQHYILLDFCYMIALLTVITLNFAQNNPVLFHVNFVLASGLPLLAVFLYSDYNAVTLTSLPHLTSAFIHFFPALALSVEKKVKLNADPNFFSRPFPEAASSNLKLSFLYPLAVYLTWQIAFLTITEIVDYDIIYKQKSRNKKYPYVATNMKFVYAYDSDSRTAKSNVFRSTLTKILRRIGVLGPVEVLNLESRPKHHLFALAFFVIFSFILFASLLPLGHFMFVSEKLNAAILIVAYSRLIYNGAKVTFNNNKEQITDTAEISETSLAANETESGDIYSESGEAEENTEGGDKLGDNWNKGSIEKKVETETPEKVRLKKLSSGAIDKEI